MILIYHDIGASSESVTALLRIFDELKKPAKIINAHDIIHSAWHVDANWFVMPGGRSLPFYDALGNAGNARIVEFVKKGGRYLGLCAGAYYASAKTIFAQSKPLELILNSELNFFAGDAIGPVLSADLFAYQSEKGACITDIIDEENKHFSVYVNGGCYFDGVEKDMNSRILARYVDHDLPAIIQCNVHLGSAVLCGVHPELSPDLRSQTELLIKIMA